MIPSSNRLPQRNAGKKPGGLARERRDYTHLPAREEQSDLPEDDKVCDCCGKPFADLGQSDASEQIEIETVVYRRVVCRKCYRQICDCADRRRTITAPLPPRPLPKSIYGTSLWVHLLLEKVNLQRPMHRAAEQLRLLVGLSLAPRTINDGLKRIEPLFTPPYDTIRPRHVQSAASVRCDVRPVRQRRRRGARRGS